MDGLLLKLNTPGSLTFSFFGGGDVAYYHGYNTEDLIVGGELRGKVLPDLNLGLAYLQKLIRATNISR